jgi:hypothetical protein
MWQILISLVLEGYRFSNIGARNGNKKLCFIKLSSSKNYKKVLHCCRFVNSKKRFS